MAIAKEKSGNQFVNLDVTKLKSQSTEKRENKQSLISKFFREKFLQFLS
jgi:hypothetical protein